MGTIARQVHRPSVFSALLLVASALLTAPCATQAGPVAHLAFDDLPGSAVAADWVNGHDGALIDMNPSTDWVTGKVGGGLDLDGNLDHVIVSDASALDFGSGDFSVSVWIKKRATNQGTWDNVWGVNKWNTGASAGTNEWTLGLGNDKDGDVPGFGIQSGTTSYTATSPEQISLNAWHHLVGVRSGGTLKFYVDGDQKATASVGTAAVNNVGRDLYIGAAASGTTYCTDMVVDELQIYDQALSTAQVQALHDSPASTITDPVKIYWAWNNGGSVGGVQRCDPDGSSIEAAYSPSNYPAGCAVDPSVGKLYYTLAGGRDIRRSDLDGDNVQTLNGDTGGYTRGIDLDLTNGKLYWAQSDAGSQGEVLRANLDGSGTESLFNWTADGLMDTTDIVLDVPNNTFYCTDYMSRTTNTDGRIFSGAMDGSGSLTVVDTGGDPRSIALDAAAGTLYWSDANGRIVRVNTDGTGSTSFITGLNKPSGLTIDAANDWLYWSDGDNNGSIKRANLSDGGNVTTIATGITGTSKAVSDMDLLLAKVPGPWRSEDVGSPAKAGLAVYHEPTGRFVLDGAGKDIAYADDQFQFVHQQVEGDFTAMVRLWSMENTEEWAKAGLMAREALVGDSALAMSVATPEHGLRFQWNDGSGSESATQMTTDLNAPQNGDQPTWLILRRVGDTFTGYYAADDGGQPGLWLGEASQTVAMSAAVELGMAVSSHDTAHRATAIFDNPSIGRWAAGGRLEVKDAVRLAGAAYAMEDLNGDRSIENHEQVPVDWTVAKLTSGLRSEWFLNTSTANWSGTPDYDLMATTLERSSYTYPAEIIAGAGLNPSSPNLDRFSVRYSGQIFADHAGTFSFQERVDDYAWLYIDGNRILYDTGWSNDTFATIMLSEGWHDIEFLTWDGVMGDKACLMWDPAGGTAWDTIPTDALRGWDTLTAGGYSVGDPLTSVYFDDIVLNDPADWWTTLSYRLSLNYQDIETHEYFLNVEAVVPEPATCLLLAGSLLALARRRRRNA